MGGLIGRLFHEFAVTLSLAVLVSGVLSLTLTPMMCSRFLRAESSYGPPGLFYRACERGFNWLLSGYEAAPEMGVAPPIFLSWWLWSPWPPPFASTMGAEGFFSQQDTGVSWGSRKRRRTFPSRP